MNKNPHRIQSVKGSLLIPFLALLMVTSFVTIALYGLRITNAHQYRLLEEDYKLKLMLEMSMYQLEDTLQFEKDIMTYPSVITFNSGTVRIQWDSSKQQFHLTATLREGQTKKEDVTVSTHEEVTIVSTPVTNQEAPPNSEK